MMNISVVLDFNGSGRNELQRRHLGRCVSWPALCSQKAGGRILRVKERRFMRLSKLNRSGEGIQHPECENLIVTVGI